VLRRLAAGLDRLLPTFAGGLDRLLPTFAGGLDLLLPRACFRCGCELDAGALCAACHAALGRPVRPVVRGLAACAAGAPYTGEVEAWVRAFKYPPRTALPDPAPEALLGALLARAGEALDAGPAPACVVPVPLHRRRLVARGFNPAGLLARRLARARGLAFDPVALARTRDTPSQTGLDARARRRNVAGAFRWARHGPGPRVVWLVDDVVTTGATLSAAARALRAAGAEHVSALAAAATPRTDERD